jgi:hypothetical protein
LPGKEEEPKRGRKEKKRRRISGFALLKVYGLNGSSSNNTTQH